MTGDVLDRFSPATAAWFRGSFSAPTAAQEGAWEAISSGHHALVVAPTGSGKTLSAFLWALDRLAAQPVPEDAQGALPGPLRLADEGARRRRRAQPAQPARRHPARRHPARPARARHHRRRCAPATPPPTSAAPSPAPPPTCSSRRPSRSSSSSPRPRARRWPASRPSSSTRSTPSPAPSAAPTSPSRLERLDALLPQPAQRIGLSATVRPVEEVARYLAGGRPVEVVQPPSTKEWDLKVVVPVPDMAELGPADRRPVSGAASGQEQRASIWPHVEERIVDLVAEHTSTLVFSNSRRLAERLTTRLNEIWEERIEAAEGAGTVGGAGCRAARRRAHPQPRAGHGPVRRLDAAPRPCSPAPTTAR